MSTNLNAPEPSALSEPEIPPSKLLQTFLLLALLVSGGAYVADQWTQMFAPRHTGPDRLHRLVESRSEYASHMESAMRAVRNRQYEAALTQFRLALQAQNSAEAHYNMAGALQKLNRPDEAVAQFKEAIRINPNYTDVYLTWGRAIMAEGRPEEAAHIFHDAVRVSPNSGPAHFEFALALLEESRAVKADQRSAEADARGSEAATLGAKLDRLQSDALQHLQQAQRLGLDRPELWLVCGQLLSDQQKFAEAESYLRKAAADKPDSADAHFSLASALVHLGGETDAVGQYSATLVLRPDDPLTLERLALLYATTTNQDLRSPKMAVQLASRANDATTAQNPRFMDTLARCHAADGDFLQAISWEDKAIHRAEQVRDVNLLRELRPRYALFIQHKTE